MKARILAVLLTVGALTAARATLYTFDFTSGFHNSGVIPDANVSGWSDTRTVSGIPFLGPNDTDEIVDVNVRLNITGGYNGDLYGYLVHSSGFTVLLNRPGRTTTDHFGYDDAGLNITLDDSATTDIHAYGGNGGNQLTDSWSPDGRAVNPATVTDLSARTTDLENFNTLSANGSWTLFLADFAVGDQSTVSSWGLDISVVPEPTITALIVFAVLAIMISLVMHLRKQMTATARSSSRQRDRD